MAKLEHALWECRSLSPVERELLSKLAWNHQAWQSGLIRQLRLVDEGGLMIHDTPFGSRPRVVWSGKMTDQEYSTCHVFLFQEVSLSHLPRTRPLICVVTDEDYRLDAWEVIANEAVSFEEASITSGEPPVLRVTCWSSLRVGRGTYKYGLSHQSIHPIGEVSWESIRLFDCGGQVGGEKTGDKKGRSSLLLTE
jgi:hypothetical protein